MVSFLNTAWLTKTNLPKTKLPKVSVIVAAKDEATKIENALHSVLKSDYPDFEVIAVNDRSEDETGKILDGLAQKNAHLKVTHIDSLPPQWLGKNHALHVAAQNATGEYLLFTDADVIYTPDVIKRSIQLCESRQIDHLCLLPSMITETFIERSLVNFFVITFLLAVRPTRVATSDMNSYVGVGAFNLIRKQVYEKVGGHKPIRMSIVDDFLLGKLIKSSGYKQEVLLAYDLLTLKWQDGRFGILKGLEKNGFASIQFSWPSLIVITLFFFAVFIVPVGMIPVAANPVTWGYFACFLSVLVISWFCARALGFGWWVRLSTVVAAPLYLGALWNSAIQTARRGGVQWRDTFYRLDELKKLRYK